ncbi:MAG: amidohydrolase family protein [Hyphomicrobiaceae bacterium]|nr:amidohydrolase family protein [Hyphomicrobiaceae bacterium]
MHDLVIRRGTVIDGSGSERRIADVAVDGGRITAVGSGLGRGRREIEADGLLVTPGFVDIHTHYDGQATWDSQLAPSSLHGVTTAIFGNCGVGFAPVKPGTSGFLINLMEGIEDIPGTVLSEGVRFDWESFPEYMAALDAIPHAIDVGAQMPHTALRFYVMGERGAVHDEQPTEAEIGRMGALLEEALAAGALGFTTSRTTKHRAKDGRLVPSLSAREPELAGLARAMRRAGRGVLEVNSDFGPGEFEAMEEAAALAGRPLSCLLVQVRQHPRLWRETLDWIHAMRVKGIDATAQVSCRGIGVMMGLETTLHPFAGHPAWLALSDLSPAARYARLKEDAGLRRRLVEERPDDETSRRVEEMLPRTFRLGPELDYEPDLARNVVAEAAERGRSVWDWTLEVMMAGGGKGMMMHPFENYADGSLDTVREMLTDPATVMGVADGGAHVGIICDASQPTFLLSYWGRDRKRGRLPMELLVRKHARETALCYGLHDRGLLAPGMKADVNVIDGDALRLLPPEVIYDLPTGGKRIMQKAKGYRHTFVSGVETLADDTPTGALPGRIVRG